MKQMTTKKRNILASIICIAIAISLVMLVLTVLSQYNDAVNDKISDRANLLTADTSAYVADCLSKYEGNATYAAGLVAKYTDAEAFSTSIREISLNSRLLGMKCFKYIKDGVVYNQDSSKCEDTEVFSKLIEDIKTKESGTYGCIINSEYSMNLLTFFSVVKGNKNIDAIILQYPQTVLLQDNPESTIENIDKSEFISLCNSSGIVLTTLYPTYEYHGIVNLSENVDIINSMNNSAISAGAIPEVTGLITGANNGIVEVTIDNESYLMSVKHNADCPSICVVSLSRAANFADGSESAMSSIGAAIVLLAVLVIGLGFTLFISRLLTHRKVIKNAIYDSSLQCFTREGFENDALESIRRFPGSKFAVVAVRLKHYRYIKEKHPDKIASINKQIRDHISSSMGAGETFGIAEEGEFVALMHTTDVEKLKTRLKALAALISRKVGTKEYNLHLDFGINEITGVPNEETFKQEINAAFQSIQADTSSTSISVYNEGMKSLYMESAEVEVKMDFALQNDEFKIFFQPKINSTDNSMDSCEVLVRWYDAEKEFYRTPGMFLPLFEQNGFIEKLDKYVFYKACEFIGLRVSQNLPVYPTSVNISRYTALSDGFIEYYASTKRKFNVPDNFITLEFTESIASASYEILNNLTKTLHQNKFLCSIDDYGSGYSSFNILKSVSVDELKLDRMFLEKGVSAECDKEILKSVVALARRLGIKIVQEGVETEEQLTYVREAGCNIIQGYYYSKPLPMIEYIDFIDKKYSEEELRTRTFDD